MLKRLLIATALLAVLSGCSARQVQLVWKLNSGEDLAYHEAKAIAREVNRTVTPGCDPSYRVSTSPQDPGNATPPCLPNNVVDVDCYSDWGVDPDARRRHLDGPVWTIGDVRVTGWDHFELLAVQRQGPNDTTVDCFGCILCGGRAAPDAPEATDPVGAPVDPEATDPVGAPVDP